MNKEEIIEKIVELEREAFNYYCHLKGIDLKDFVNPETMGLLEYENYVELYNKLTGKCFECEQNPCDEGCPYQVMKESEEQTNE